MKHIYKILILLGVILGVMVYLWISPFASNQDIEAKNWQQLIPSKNINSKLELMNSNSNLDVTKYNETYYIAFRTAPTHFASKKTKLYVLSSCDLKTWDYEHEIALGSDKREPRFAVFKDKLYLYFFQGGKVAWKFEPKRMYVVALEEGVWSVNQDLYLDGFVPWRFRVRTDTLYMSAYYGKNLYSNLNMHKGNQRLFFSTNGINFTPISEESQIPEKGVEEGEFIFDKMGNLYGTLRMEGGGSMVAFASKNNLKKWVTKFTKHKYDSALLFEHEDEFYLISRRNMDGFAKKSNWRAYNLIRYSLTKKKTALFHLNKDKLDLKWLMDFPSTGDNSFPGIVSLGMGEFFLLNYSSDIKGKEKNWIKGQLGKTYIYSTILDMKEVLTNLEQQKIAI